MAKTLPLMLVAVLVFAAAAYGVSAVPTQQYNRLLFEPFYRASMVQNTNYTYTVSVVTPDGISEVKSAIVVLEAWINPARTAYAWVNGVACATPSYTVSTTYASAGNAIFSFDCGNAIVPGEINTVTFKITGGNIGASTAWLDLTYMNDPPGDLLVHGTEYIPGDEGKMFLQFLDANRAAVDDSECFLTLWYPNGTYFYNDTLMSHLSEGIYYKNFMVPNVTGVYPASAKCYQPLDFANLEIKNYAVETWETNTWTGGTGNWSTCGAAPGCQEGWDYENEVPLASIASTGCYNGTYCAKYTGGYGFIERGVDLPEGTHAVNITFWFKFKGFQTQEHGEFYIFDGNWHLEKVFGKDVAWGGYTNEVWYQVSVYLEESDHILETILVGFYTKAMPSTGDEIWIDDVRVKVIAPNITISNETGYEILRGSGEVHVSGLYASIKGDTSAILSLLTDVWNWVQSILGITSDTQQLVSAQADLVVSRVPLGGEGYVTTFVTYADDVVDVNASCFLDAWAPDGTQWVDGQQMVAVGSDGRYVFNISEPIQLGTYQLRSFCNGSALMNRTRYAYATLEVFDGVRMEMIS
jgi:hypothetical protein